MVKTFHIAAQYLATVAISFLDPKEDDSHTNLGWKDGALHTHPLSEDNCMFSLDYRSFSLIWTNDLGYENSLSLEGKSHSEIVHWIRNSSLKAKHKKVYEYALHYELFPYEKIKSDFVFVKPSKQETDELIAKRDIVQKALENVLKRKNQNTSIRIWPHHFDSGSFFMVNDEIGIGLGMAIPDGMINAFYFYVSGYKGHDGIELSSAIELEKGDYYNSDWKGIALAVSGLTVEEATEFYEQSINHYLNQ